MNQRAQVSLVEAHSLREERRVNAPFVLGATESSRPIDDDLALAQAQVTAIEQPACEDLSEEPFVPGECCEQDERSDAGRHNPVECTLDFSAEWRDSGCDSCRHRRCAIVSIASYWNCYEK